MLHPPLPSRRVITLLLALVLGASTLMIPVAIGATTPSSSSTTTTSSIVTTTTIPAAAILAPGQTLLPGQELLNSAGVAFAQLTMKGDFILHNGTSIPWHSKTKKGAVSITMQRDGNLVMRNAKGKALWSTKTSGGGNRLQLDALGNLDIVSSGQLLLWRNGAVTTNTVSNLGSGQALKAGQYLVSLDGTQRAALSSTGAFFDSPTASTGSVGWVTPNAGGTELYMNPNGNLELKDVANHVLWSTLTSRYRGAQLQLLNSGVLQLVTPNNVAVWHVSQSVAPVTSSALGSKIIASAESYDQYAKHPVAERPMGSECNPFTKLLGWGTPTYRIGSTSFACPSGTRSESWCSDFGTYLWRKAGVVSTGLTAWSYSFVEYGLLHNTFKLGSLNHPQVGDAMVFGSYNTRDPYAGYGAHVGLVAAVKGQQIAMVSGNWNEAVVLTGFFNPSSFDNGQGYPIIGYISPFVSSTATSTTSTSTTLPATTTTTYRTP